MKQIALALTLLASAALVSCDAHTWEDGADGSKGTKRLFLGHGSHDDDHAEHDSHKDDHDGHKEDKGHH